MSVTLTAAACPAVQVPSSMLSIAGAATGDGNALVAKNTLASISWRNDTANPNATILDRIGSEGGVNAHAVTADFPPALSVGAGIALAVSAGECAIGGPVQYAGGTVVVPDNTARIWIWLARAGMLAAVATSLTPPAGAQCLLGSCTTVGGNVVAVDTSGVMYLKGGSLWRRSSDLGAPTDTPPSTVAFVARTGDGLYYWDGTAYTAMTAATVALSDAIAEANERIVDLQAILGDLINQLVNIGLDDILSGELVAAAFDNANEDGILEAIGV